MFVVIPVDRGFVDVECIFYSVIMNQCGRGADVCVRTTKVTKIIKFPMLMNHIGKKVHQCAISTPKVKYNSHIHTNLLSPYNTSKKS